MKNALLIINVILLALVGYLYYLQFGSKKSSKGAEAQKEVSDTTNKKVNIAYIDLDSLQNNYTYYKKIKVDFERKQTSANNEITGMQKRFQNRAMVLQEKAQNMSPQEQENAMQEMNKMQNDLQIRKQNIDNELFDYNTKMKDDILFRIQDFLKIYNKDGKYSYIFSYEPGFMFYKDSTLDITSDVITGLNELYTKEKK
ncbi:MAG: OmpH family outer membrane protein [Ginsengibacter sp.]